MTRERLIRKLKEDIELNIKKFKTYRKTDPDYAWNIRYHDLGPRCRFAERYLEIKIEIEDDYSVEPNDIISYFIEDKIKKHGETIEI